MRQQRNEKSLYNLSSSKGEYYNFFHNSKSFANTPDRNPIKVLVNQLIKWLTQSDEVLKKQSKDGVEYRHKYECNDHLDLVPLLLVLTHLLQRLFVFLMLFLLLSTFLLRLIKGLSVLVNFIWLVWDILPYQRRSCSLLFFNYTIHFKSNYNS